MFVNSVQHFGGIFCGAKAYALSKLLNPSSLIAIHGRSF